MPSPRKARLVPLAEAFAAQHPGRDDLAALLEAGALLADGRPITNIDARVPRTAAIQVRPDAPLRGSAKLEAALGEFAIDVDGRIALDAGAAAGGFTTTLLAAGAARVYAVDVGHGQLRGSLRQDPRVVVLERTNLADLDVTLVPDPVDVVTLDLSYLSLAGAVPQLERVQLAHGADLVVLVKPMFELALAEPPSDPAEIARAVDLACTAIAAGPWTVVATIESPVTGAHGAVEHLIHAHRNAP